MLYDLGFMDMLHDLGYLGFSPENLKFSVLVVQQ